MRVSPRRSQSNKSELRTERYSPRVQQLATRTHDIHTHTIIE